MVLPIIYCMVRSLLGALTVLIRRDISKGVLGDSGDHPGMAPPVGSPDVDLC